MRKKNLFLVMLILTCNILFAKQVDVKTAQNMAVSFLTGKTQLRNAPQSTLKLAHTAKQESMLRSGKEQVSYYYVFNIGENNGFIIVSADDVNVPIIGYSKEGKYDVANLPDNFRSWMESIESGMADAISKEAKSPQPSQSKGNTASLRASAPGPGGSGEEGSEGSGDFLIQTKWNQRYPYNQSIPYLINGTTKPVTGCVATAMAQVMKYYNYPVSGKKQTTAYQIGPVSNQDWIPSIDLTQYRYDWSQMLNTYNEYESTINTEVERNAVSLLMYHVGASVTMKFGPTSGAPTINAAKALVECYGYDADLFNINRSYYSSKDWTDLMKNEIKNKRPVFYEGWSRSAGHAFICDGYDENGLFHFNWGWGGYNDGYFSLDAPLEFSLNQQIIANIKPENGIQESLERIVTSLYVDKNTYKKNEIMNINYSVKEPSIVNRAGDYYAALYSMTDEFVSLTTHTQTQGKKYNQIGKDIPAGSYKVKVVEKVSSGEYMLLKQTPGVGGDKIITVTNEIKNHTLTVSGMSLNNYATYPGNDVEVSLSLYNPIEGDVSIGILLIDSDNNQQFINQAASERMSASYYTKYTCKIPENTPAGFYKIKPVAKEETTSWDTIPPFYSSGITYLDFEIFADVSEYRINQIFPNKSSLKRNESFKVAVNMQSTVDDKSRVSNLKCALYDQNDILVSILETIEGLNENRGRNVYFYSKISKSILPGVYKLKMVEKTDANTHILAPVIATNIEKQITVSSEILYHELEILERSEFTVDKTTVSPGEYLQASVCFGNLSDYPFKGCYGMALTDQNDQILYVFATSCGRKLDGGYLYPIYSFYGYLPSNVVPGNYRLRMIAKVDGDDWGIVKDRGNGYTDYLNITVTAIGTRSTTANEQIIENKKISVYPNPVVDKLFINSPGTEIKRITLYDLSGKVVFINQVVETEKSVSLKHLPKNMYILKVETAEGEWTYKINKQ